MSAIDNLTIVQSLADILLDPPDGGRLAVVYYTSARRAALALGIPASSTLDRDSALMLRNKIFETISRINSFVGRAKTAGFAPPENPFLAIAGLNDGREVGEKIDATPERASQIIEDISQFLALLQAEDSGDLKLQLKSADESQISSFSLSVDGFKGSSGTKLTLASFLPNVDQIKYAKALDSLSKFDFSKRIPKVIFVSEYDPDDTGSKGFIVGWKKMADASGYYLRRHDIFTNDDAEFIYDNVQMAQSTSQFSQYVRDWVLSFYDDIDLSDIVCAFDSTVQPNRYYSYSVQAYQQASTDQDSIFSVGTAAGFLTPMQLTQVRAIISSSLGSFPDENLAIDDVSPYPALAQVALGDSKYDWVLAALNVRASTLKMDPIDRVRSYSYLGSSFSFISSEIAKGNFVVPQDVSEVVQNVKTSISSFGVSQTLTEILDKTGMLFYFGNKDGGGTKNILDVASSAGLLGTILSKIDFESATLDPRLLASSISSSPPVVSTRQAQEIVVSSPTATITNAIADGPSQWISTLGKGEDLIDLTSFEGLSRFIRTIRMFFDFSTRRNR